jgi:heat shock protein HslJ
MSGNRNPSRVGLAAIGAVACVVLVGCVDRSGSAGDPGVQDLPLVGTAWQLHEVRTGGASRAVSSEVGASVRFDGKGGISGNTGCNGFGGRARIGDDVLDVDDVSQTLIACSGVEGEIERLTTRVLRGRVSWTVDGEELRLAKPGGSTLIYRARAAAFVRPDRQSRERVTALEPSTPIADPTPR